MPAEPTIRLATRTDLPDLGHLLARAFADDPVHLRLTEPAGYDLERATAWFLAELRIHFDHGGEIRIDSDRRAVAIWTGPGRWAPTLRQSLPTLLPSLRHYRRSSLRGLRLVAAMERAHPGVPHRYLAYLATDPDHQGTGIGGALLRHEIAVCDAQGLPAYLESSKDDNISWYARFGFRAREPVGPPGGPVLTPMWRDPEEPA